MKKIKLFIAMLLFTAFNYSAQALESHTVACTAGNLAAVAASYLTTVTDLTVTGTIDARDFKTMRDDMPLLEVIDLSGSTVAAYFGTVGTNGSIATAYPANGIPNLAFCISLSDGKISLKSFIYPSSVKFIGSYAFSGCSGLSGSLTIPSSVTAIYEYSYSRCSGFTGQLTIPSSVTTIGNGAFFGCSGFTSLLTISSSVTTIGEAAFSSCSSLFVVDAANPNYSSLDGIIFNKDKTTLIQCSISKTGTLTIPSSVKFIGSGAFSGCSGFTGSLTIPSSVTTINNNAFRDCSGFTGSLTIPSSVTEIGEDAFRSCSGFTGSLTIPSSVTTISYYAFDSCSGFTSIYALAKTPIDISGVRGVFYNINPNICILHVPVGSMALYEAADQWSDFITNIVDDIVPTSLEVLSTHSISIFPNPATSSITVSELSSLATDKIVTISVNDVLGSTLLIKEVKPSLDTLTIDVSTFKNGIYFIDIQTSNRRVVKRFVKE